MPSQSDIVAALMAAGISILTNAIMEILKSRQIIAHRLPSLEEQVAELSGKIDTYQARYNQEQSKLHRDLGRLEGASGKALALQDQEST